MNDLERKQDSTNVEQYNAGTIEWAICSTAQLLSTRSNVDAGANLVREMKRNEKLPIVEIPKERIRANVLTKPLRPAKLKGLFQIVQLFSEFDRLIN